MLPNHTAARESTRSLMLYRTGPWDVRHKGRRLPGGVPPSGRLTLKPCQYRGASAAYMALSWPK